MSAARAQGHGSPSHSRFGCKRLYLQIYLTLIVGLVAFAIIAAFLWRQMVSEPQYRGRTLIAEIAQSILPEPTAPREQQQAALERLAANGRVNVALYEAEGARIALVGPELPTPAPGEWRAGWNWRFGVGPIWSAQLGDGRWLIARPPENQRRHPAFAFFVTLAVIATVLAVVAYPAARRVTRRLEHLRASVDALGAGNLSTRVDVVGRDEVAALAASFNRSAERIEALIGAHKTLLANASHELRSPLARVRVGLELLQAGPRPELHDELKRNIAELDTLIDEILLASRLDMLPALDVEEPVELLALCAEEGARFAAQVDGEEAVVQGSPRLLRRMVRNLLDNARRHGGDEHIEVMVRRNAVDQALLTVCDCGPGVPEAERERIFEPFYRPAGTREADGGVGLGLALVRQIARKHRGEVVCRSRAGGGSCFEVELPAATASRT